MRRGREGEKKRKKKEGWGVGIEGGGCVKKKEYSITLLTRGINI